jgi:hypothetical protein
MPCRRQRGVRALTSHHAANGLVHKHHSRACRVFERRSLRLERQPPMTLFADFTLVSKNEDSDRLTTLNNTFLFGRAGATDRQYHMSVIPTQLRPPKQAAVVVNDAGVGHGGTVVRVQGTYWLLGGAYYDEEHWFDNLEGETIEPRDGIFLADMVRAAVRLSSQP